MNLSKKYLILPIFLFLHSHAFSFTFFGEWWDYDNLFDAAVHERVENIERLASQKGRINEKGPLNYTPLQFAIYKKLKPEILSTLVECGADIEARDDFGNTALLFACQKGTVGAIDLLIERGAKIEVKNRWGRNALMEACYRNRAEVVEELLLAGANMNASNDLGMTSLMVATLQGNIEAAKMLLDAGVALNAKTTDDIDIVSQKGRATTTFKKGSTALTFARLCGGLGMHKLLLEYGAEDPFWDKSSFKNLEKWYEI